MSQRLHNRFIVVSYLFYIAVFGSAACLFLWLRDIRIFMRTGLDGYRISARTGVIHTAITTAGAGEIMLFPSADILGIGIVLLGLYLQGQQKREVVFSTESVIDRALGKARIKR
ncbi:ABC transporter permease [Methanospirillum lacunae]|uniref:ABC transporter permease n=1 Tax=Methanospirillum lacunae TaxID=668570 RepID=UPI001FE41E49|nr:ABC transporter permease [Methanospirillum lacunae]